MPNWPTISTSKKTPVAVVLRIKPGEVYRLAGFTIAGENPALHDGRIRVDAKEIGLEAGSVAASQPVIDAEQKILSLLGEQAYPLACVEDRRVVVDHETRRMTVEWRIDTGPKARFGEVSIVGLQDVDRKFVESLLPWRRGEPYDGRKVKDGRVTLVETRLFGVVRIAHGEKVDADGELPVTVTVTEAKHRSIGAGVRYSTSEGPLGKVFWEHRNLFNEGERLNLSLTGGLVIQGAQADFRNPGIWTPDVDFLAGLFVKRENSEAYEAETAGTIVGLEYRLDDTITLTGGVGFERERIDEDNTRQTFGLLSFPLSVIYDTTSDLLDPKDGTRATASLTPYTSVVSSDVDFLVNAPVGFGLRAAPGGWQPGVGGMGALRLHRRGGDAGDSGDQAALWRRRLVGAGLWLSGAGPDRRRWRSPRRTIASRGGNRIALADV